MVKSECRSSRRTSCRSTVSPLEAVCRVTGHSTRKSLEECRQLASVWVRGPRLCKGHQRLAVIVGVLGVELSCFVVPVGIVV